MAIGASTIPIIAFAPITLNWFGPESLLPRVTIVAVMVFFPVMVNTIRGLTNVDPAALELLSSYAASDAPDARPSCAAPNALPYWFTALRIATTLSVIGAVVGEFFGGPLYALGIYITLETGHSRYPTAWAAIVLACVLGIVLYLVAVALERLVDPVVHGARDRLDENRRVAYHRRPRDGHRVGRRVAGRRGREEERST